MLTGVRLKRLMLAAGALTLAGVFVNAGVTTATSADGTDPITTPVPMLDDDDTAKAVVTRMTFDGRTTATVRDVTVSEQRAHSHAGDPPILRLTLQDADRTTIESLNAWSPLWVFSRGATRERLEIQSTATGSFVVPFSQTLSTMVVRDVGLARDVTTVDLEPAIREFCTAHPDDPDCFEADLAVSSEVTPAPRFVVIGRAATVETTATVVNLGPDGPVTGTVTQSVAAGPDVTVTPTAARTSDVDLAVDTPTTLSRSYTVTCNAPGAHHIDVTTSITPKRATVIDDDSTNNMRTTRVSLDCAVPITINVQPRSARNPVNLTGSTLPVAALTTRAGEYGNPLAFDARQIIGSTARLGSEAALQTGAGVPETHGVTHPEDSYELDERTRDRDIDVLLHFRPRATALSLTDTEACVLGRFGSPALTFFGCDRVTVLP